MQHFGLLGIALLASSTISGAATAATTNTDSITPTPSTYSAAAGFAHEVNHDYYVAGAALIAAAVILL